MSRFTDVAERYGNWCANTRLPQAKYVRRLAQSNPADFGKYALFSIGAQLVYRTQISRLRKKIKELEAANQAILQLKTDEVTRQLKTLLNTDGTDASVKVTVTTPPNS